MLPLCPRSLVILNAADICTAQQCLYYTFLLAISQQWREYHAGDSCEHREFHEMNAQRISRGTPCASALLESMKRNSG
jgi:hypothetical protein